MKSSAPKTIPGGWVLNWSDEFNGSKLDTSKWKHETGVVRNPGSKQVYTDRKKNVRVENGCLVLETHHETFKNPNFKQGGTSWPEKTRELPYTSGSVTTRGVKNFQFGRLEFRAKIPKAKGVWPALWTMHENKWGWPANGEIDILEHISQEPDNCYTVFRWGDKGSDKEFKIVKTTQLPDYSKDFHIYVLEWDPSEMKVSIDGKPVGKIKMDQSNYPCGGNPLRTPCYLIMNTALGGDWCEQPSPEGYPAKFLIDYVRFYQRPQDAEAAKKTDPKTGKMTP